MCEFRPYIPNWLRDGFLSKEENFITRKELFSLAETSCGKNFDFFDRINFNDYLESLEDSEIITKTNNFIYKNYDGLKKFSIL